MIGERYRIMDAIAFIPNETYYVSFVHIWDELNNCFIEYNDELLGLPLGAVCEDAVIEIYESSKGVTSFVLSQYDQTLLTTLRRLNYEHNTYEEQILDIQ